jgi:acid phosphatase (class A)
MKNNRRLALGFCGLLAIGAVAWAKSEVENPHWLSHDDIAAIIQQEPPPPAPGSVAEQTDLQAELAAQTSRTPARIAEANTDAGYSVQLFTTLIVPPITPQSDPRTFLFFDRLNKQIAKVVGDSKEHWHRPRPYLTHAEIHPLFQANGYSYPSGHSTHSFAFAVILGQLFPDKAAAFIDRAHQIAQSRVDAGVHYTSDIREGEVVGHEIAKELLAKPTFMAELNAAKAELAGKKAE